MARQETAGQEPARENVIATFGFGYLIMFILLAMLIMWGDTWEVLADTRILALLMDAGIVAVTDADRGFILGVPSVGHLLNARDAVDWRLVIVAGGLFAGYWGLRAVQLHAIAMFAGGSGTFWQNVRAYLYGDGLGRLIPFYFGITATVSMLHAQGTSWRRAAYINYISNLTHVLEIAFFTIVVLFLVGWSTWLNSLPWALAILAGAFLLTRRGRSTPLLGPNLRENLRATIENFSQAPATVIPIAVISLGAFFLLDAAAYLLVTAYTGFYVNLGIDSEYLLLGIVCGYLARLIQVTPGGMGQFEWGFASALYAAGAGTGEAASVALIYGGVRFGSGLIILIALRLLFGAEATFARMFQIFRGAEPEPQAAA